VVVGRSEKGERWWRCGFDNSVLAREGRRQDETLPENEAEAVSSSWFYEKKAWHGVTMSARGEVTPGRRK
jgi:hypothetical protein